MARLSKTQHFAVFEDGLTSTTSSQEEYYGPPQKRRCVTIGSEELKEDARDQGPTAKTNSEQLEVPEQTGDDVYLYEDSRASILTTTSISTLSEYYTEEHDVFHIPNALPAPILRPRFRRPESIRRMQMSSPSPSEPCSPRSSTSSRSYLNRAGELQLVPTARLTESPRARKKKLDKQQQVYQERERSLPLILLHVTLLPINLPWSPECMQELLPATTLENLRLLRSKISETVLHRGVLIPHPCEEYEMLEEHLLEAMELKDERLTKCGHFQKRLSEDSVSTATNNDQDSDSGVGFSVDGWEGDLCAICRHHIKTSTTAVGSGNKKWTVKVYAANGLMGSSAWAAAWSEMERVDVEILPWISEDLRRKLDERQQQDDAESRDAREDAEVRIREIVEEQVRMAHEEYKRLNEAKDTLRRDESSAMPASPEAVAQPQAKATSTSREVDILLESTPQGLPQICQPSQIPLSVLLKNYLNLLAQDRRNIVLLVVILVAIFLSIRSPAVNHQIVNRSSEGERSGSHQADAFKSQVPSAAKVDMEDTIEQTAVWQAEDLEIDESELSSAASESERIRDGVDEENSGVFDMADD